MVNRLIIVNYVPENMERRQFLLAAGAGIGSLLVAAIAGTNILDSSSHSPSLPTGFTIETKAIESSATVVENDSKSPTELPSERVTNIPDAEAAAQKLQEEETIQEFVADTDLPLSYIVVVEHQIAGNEELRVETIKRTENGLRMTLGITAPGNLVNDEAKTGSLLIRCTDDEAGVPDAIEVTVEE